MAFRRSRKSWSIELDTDTIAPGDTLTGNLVCRGFTPGSRLPIVHWAITSEVNHPTPGDPLRIDYDDATWCEGILGQDVPVGDDARVPFRLAVPVACPTSEWDAICPKLRLTDGADLSAKASIWFDPLPVHRVVRSAIDSLGWSSDKTEVWLRDGGGSGVAARWELFVRADASFDERLPPEHRRPTVRVGCVPTDDGTEAFTPVAVTAVGPDGERILGEVALDLDLDDDPQGAVWAQDLREEAFSLLDPTGPPPSRPPVRRRRRGPDADVAAELLDGIFDFFV